MSTPKSESRPESIRELDPVMEEVHALKRDAAQRFEGDVPRLHEHLKEIERRHAARVVAPPASRSPGKGRAA